MEFTPGNLAAVAASQRWHQVATQSYPPCLVCAITVPTHGMAWANRLVLSGRHAFIVFGAYAVCVVIGMFSFDKMSWPAKKRNFLWLQDKTTVIVPVEKGRKKKDMADEFVLKCSLLSTILKSKATMFGALASGASVQNKTVTAVAFPNIDKAVFAWFREQCHCLAKCFNRRHWTSLACLMSLSEEKKKLCTEGKPARNLLDAFDMIWSFLGAHNYSVAMDYFLQCESRAVKLLWSCCKVRLSKVS